ncbi:hypothetical protein ABHI18_004610 [Aspergillus niger]
MFQRLRNKLNFTKRNRHGRGKDDKQPPPPSTKDDRVVANAESPTLQRVNLWEVAGENLDENDRKALGLEDPSPITDALERVIKTTEEKYREYKEGGLKIRKRDGGHINVRDSAKNIILHALQTQDIVTKLAAFDPTGHASTAWSVVSIGLSMIKNDIERRDDIFHAAEYLAGILSYYVIVDDQYRERKVESDRGLEDSLVGVYTAVLQYAAEVKRAEQQSEAARVRESIRALVQKPLEDLKEAIYKKEQAVQKWTNLTAALDHRKQAESMLNGIDEAVERLKMIQSHTRSLQDREILDWLSTASYSDPQNNTQGHRASNTGNWFLDLPEYKEWKITPGKICWLYGAVGCGKSVLCSTVIQDIEESCRSDISKNFAYWYFQFSNDETQKVYNMSRSILRQFMPRTLPPSMISLWDEHHHRGSKPQQQKFADILDIVLESSRGEFFLILDALDECPTTGDDERGSLLQFLEELLKKHQTKIHILATSRPEPDIRSRLEQYQSVNLESGLGEDVETFVRAQVAHGRLCEWGESVKKRTLEKLLDIPERRFRWADLQIKRLEESKTEAAFYKALDTIPATLEDTYKDTLERLSGDDREAARTILMWLSFSAVPLDLKTVAAVVSFRFPEDVVTTCTTSLVTVSIPGDTVRLAHFSVKEFLVRNEAMGHWYQFSTISGHHAIASRTIDCLLETTEVLTKTTAVQQPLLIYAAKYWDCHLTELGDLNVKSSLQQKIIRLFTERNVYFNWMRLIESDSVLSIMWYQSFEELQPPLSSASERGLKPAVEMLLANGADPLESTNDGFRHNELLIAADKGHLEVLQLLLNKVDKISQWVTAQILTFINVTEANKENMMIILDLLWDKGVLHDQSRPSHRIISEKIVESAASNGKSGRIILYWLLVRQEKMGVKETERLLRAMIWNTGCNEILHLLLDKYGAEIKLTPSLKRVLMSKLDTDAAIAVLKRLVNDIVLDEEWLEAFAKGKKEAMELLLQERGKEIQVTQKVLIMAIRVARDPQMVRLLLDRREPGTNIDRKVLLAAAENELKGSEIMDMLLSEREQDIAIDDEIIQVIAQNSEKGLEMIKTLLCRQQAGFVVTEQIFCTAARHHGQEMLELLVNNAGDFDLPITEETLHSIAKNYRHGRALMEFLFNLRGHSLPVSEELLVSVADGDPGTAKDLCTYILERWPDIPVTDRLLEAACIHTDAMSLLLDRRSDGLPIERMIHRIAQSRFYGAMVLSMLLDRQLLEVDEWLVETVAGNYGALEVIYDRFPDFPVTSNTMVNVAGSSGAMRILLDRQKNQVLITEEVIKTSLLEDRSGSVIRLLLTRLGPEAVPITQNLLVYSVQTNNINSLELFLKQCHDLDLSAVWEAIWQDPEIYPSTVALAAWILFRYARFDVSTKMLERLPSVFQEEYFILVYPLDIFIRACMRHRIPLPATEAAVELIVERASLDTVEIFLNEYSDVSITEKHIEAATRNPRKDIDKDELVSLLLSARKSSA